MKEEEINFSKLTPNERQEILNIEKDFNQGMASVFDLIAPSSFEVNFDHLRIEGLYAQSYYIFSYPRFIEANWLSPVVNFDITFDISQFIYPTTSEKIMRVLKKKVAQMQSTIRMNAEKGKVHDPAIETSLQDAEQLRVELQRGQERYFQFALYITVYAEDSDKLKKIEKQLQSLLGGKLVITKRADFQMEQAFTSTCPLGLDQVEIFRNMNTSPLSTTFPFSSSDLTSNEGILYGINRHNDSLIIFDRFSLENANSVVFAKSGAGKSYAVKLEILRSMMLGSDVIVIDPENEYEALANTVGGTYLKVSLNSDRRINPFDLPKPIDADEMKPGDLLRTSIISLSGLLKLMLGEVSPAEEGIIDKALLDVYATRGITMDTPNPGDFEPPTMDDFYNVLSSMEGATPLSQRLTKYVSGTYAGIFNKATNINLEEGMMVFCIRDLEEALRPIAMYIILNYIWNMVRGKLKKRILVIDEAWTMMRHKDSAEFLFGLVKRARKYYLGVSTITQDVEDFLNSELGKPIITNSSMQLLLKQAPSALDALTKTFNLTQGERYMLLNSGVGQGLFFAGLKHVALQIIASYSEDKIVTTNPEEILKQRGGGYA
ncbi:conjugal transfer protein TraC [Candidatus Peregrinibacteria bacterium RIFOXYB2_FULL_33_20]|nr:MAG: conjugal transfer protein TraC [Candidatus Peregrinibacteria bacterium RIFOXYA2_FULL_33_21]OGJ50565.1 MAG: conjugal transfer protein TraC [Candidatus Peregrinibacteria bacterium RIFOXYB2_FULL_33_20]